MAPVLQQIFAEGISSRPPIARRVGSMDIRPKLAKTSVDSILSQAKAFNEFTSSKRYTEEWEDREEHRELVKNLTAESLRQLDEFEFRKMLFQLLGLSDVGQQ